MVEAKRGLSRADVFLALNRKPVINGVKIPPLGGRFATPEEETRMGEQLRRELHDHKTPIIKARTRVYQAMSGCLAEPTEETTMPSEIKPH